MKRVLYLTIILLCLFIITGCTTKSSNKELPDNPIEFKRGMISTDDSDEYYPTIEYEDNKFIMYGSLKTKDGNSYDYAFGPCLGFVDNDQNDRVFELKGESKDKWLISYYVNGEMEEPIVLKEVSYNDNIKIPDSV